MVTPPLFVMPADDVTKVCAFQIGIGRPKRLLKGYYCAKINAMFYWFFLITLFKKIEIQINKHTKAIFWRSHKKAVIMNIFNSCSKLSCHSHMFNVYKVSNEQRLRTQLRHYHVVLWYFTVLKSKWSILLLYETNCLIFDMPLIYVDGWHTRILR